MESLFLILKIIMVNIVLSGDNAVVIAMASKNLPERQRNKAVWWGAALAVVLRIILTVVAVFLLEIPMIQLLGSLLLMYIAVKLLLDEEGHDENVKSASTLGAAVWTILVADFVMSLDNVLAIAAIAEGNWLLIVIGILISIPLIVWGSTLVMKLLHKYPVLIYIGAGILGYTAGEMFLKDQTVARWIAASPGTIHWAVPIGAAAAVVAAGLWKKRRTA